MSRTDPQFNLRIPQELRDRVVAAAQANKRSATAEILARLEESFATHMKGVSADAPLVVVDERGPSADGSMLHSKRTMVLPSPNQLMEAMGETRRQMEQLQAQLDAVIQRQSELIETELKKE